MLKYFLKQINNDKGLTIVELVVVLAILGIIGAIAVPKFAGIQEEARIKADAATAAEIINAAIIMEVNSGEETEDGEATDTNWDGGIMAWPTPQSTAVGESGEDTKAPFTLTKEGGLYKVTWKPDNSERYDEQTVTEGVEFELKKK